MMEQQSIPVHRQQSDIFIMFSVIIIYYDAYFIIIIVTINRTYKTHENMTKTK